MMALPQSMLYKIILHVLEQRFCGVYLKAQILPLSNSNSFAYSYLKKCKSLNIVYF